MSAAPAEGRVRRDSLSTSIMSQSTAPHKGHGKDADNGLLATYCRVYGLDLDAERVAIRHRQRDSSRRAYALAEGPEHTPTPPPRLDPHTLAGTVRDLVSQTLADELPAALRVLQPPANGIKKVYNGRA